MANEVKILVACGSGVATSTVAQEAVKKILADANIPGKILKGSMSEIPLKQNDVDLILTTTNYRKPLEKKEDILPIYTIIKEHPDKSKEQIYAILKKES